MNTYKWENQLNTDQTMADNIDICLLNKSC